MTDHDTRTLLRADDIVAAGMSAPVGARPIPPFPFQFRDVEFLTFAWRTDRQRLESMLPEGLVATSDVVLAHLAHMPDTDWLGEFHEMNIMVGCRHVKSGKLASYSLYLVLDSASGVAQGREVHGQPKKYGRPTFRKQGDMWVGEVSVNDYPFFHGTMTYKRQRSSMDSLLQYFDFRTNINLKIVDHIDGRPAIRQLTARELSSVKVKEIWQEDCTVELRPHVQLPVYKLPVLEALSGFYWVATFDLVPGYILTDYLNERA